MARFKLVFTSEKDFVAATAIETPGVTERVINAKRRSLSVEVAVPSGNYENLAAVARAETPLATLADRYAAEIVEDYRYELDSGVDFLVELSLDQGDASLHEVLRMNGAASAHAISKGKGVTLCIVDTGVDGTHPEFTPARRGGGWATIGEDAWTDWEGHGTMCMTIAGAGSGGGSRFLGVAPEAALVSCRTHFYDSELTAIYDMLTERAKTGEKIVVSNSFGNRTGTPPQDPGRGSQFNLALDEAVAAGVLAVFSAGNNHQLARGLPSACDPNSVWLHKSRADVMAVATCDLEGNMWFYSSRGPGQNHGEPGTNLKPDVTAPTPRNGRILYGAGESVLANGWGTSGACPQVAGLAALIWSARPSLSSGEVIDLIKNTSRDLGFGPNCQGSGLIDCVGSLRSLALS